VVLPPPPPQQQQARRNEQNKRQAADKQNNCQTLTGPSEKTGPAWLNGLCSYLPIHLFTKAGPLAHPQGAKQANI
jgi:hypothetical protein